MILLQQVQQLMEDIKDDMTNGKAGTDDTLFLKTQNDLIAEVVATELALADKTFTATTVSVTHVIPVGVGNGNTLIEYHVNNGVDGYNRAVKSDTIKDATIELTTVYVFKFEVVI